MLNYYKNTIRITSGITLIALVVTIVVLLILAGITISLVFSENGIISKAREAAEKTNQAVINEQKQLNSLIEELEKENERETAKIEVIGRGEDTISVRVNGENLTKYQFSIDGEHYTEEQSESEYTFTGLNKVIVNEANYKTAKGTEYTIYAKAQNASTGEVICKPVSTSTIVEVEGDASKFTYEELENEIYITGIKSSNIIEDSKIPTEGMNIQEFVEDPNIILIPSYINGKPVTKVSNNLFMQNINSELTSYENATLLVYDVYTNILKSRIGLASFTANNETHTWENVSLPTR